MITKSVRHLIAGDTLAGSGFVVEAVGRGLRTPSGRMDVLGHYPNRPTRLYSWNLSTTVEVLA